MTLVVLALQILNLSICNAQCYDFDYFNDHSAQRDYNPVDSFAELLIESCPGFENAFPEMDKPNSDKGTAALKQNVGIKLIQLDFFPKLSLSEQFCPLAERLRYPSWDETYSYLFFEEINHPPS